MADRETRYVILYEATEDGSPERETMTAREIREMGVSDMASWMNFLRFMAGGPPALMTLYDTDGKPVKGGRFLVANKADVGNMSSFENPPSPSP